MLVAIVCDLIVPICCPFSFRYCNAHLCCSGYIPCHFRSRGTTSYECRHCRVSMSWQFPTSQTITQIVVFSECAFPMLTLPPLLAFQLTGSDLILSVIGFRARLMRFASHYSPVPRRMCQNLDDVLRSDSLEPLCPFLREVANSLPDLRVHCFISTDIIHIPHDKGQPTTTRLRHNVPKFERWAARFGALDDHATISRLARLYMRQRLLDRQDLHIDEVQRPLQIG